MIENRRPAGATWGWGEIRELDSIATTEGETRGLQRYGWVRVRG